MIDTCSIELDDRHNIDRILVMPAGIVGGYVFCAVGTKLDESKPYIIEQVREMFTRQVKYIF